MENKGLLFIWVNSNQWLNSAYNEVTLEPTNLDIYFSLNWQWRLRGKYASAHSVSSERSQRNTCKACFTINMETTIYTGHYRYISINRKHRLRKTEECSHTKWVILYHVYWGHKWSISWWTYLQWTLDWRSLRNTTKQITNSWHCYILVFWRIQMVESVVFRSSFFTIWIKSNKKLCVERKSYYV